MFIRVDLPAPFSPRRQWISPGSITRSIRSFAVKLPNRLVKPLISSRMAPLRSSPSCARQVGAVVDHPDLSSHQIRFNRSGGVDLNSAVDDLLLEVVDRRRQFLVDLSVRAVRREAHALVLQRAVVGLVAEVAARGVED